MAQKDAGMWPYQLPNLLPFHRGRGTGLLPCRHRTDGRPILQDGYIRGRSDAMVANAGKATPFLWDERPNTRRDGSRRSEEHTSELQSLMRISYALFCLKKQN